MLPEILARLGVEAQQTLKFSVNEAIRQENATISYRRPRISLTDWR
jgi:hypothetical protein